uniref:Uncharacterized protein n=1 Tax=virus sp. ct8MV80 TaxID=2826793 RepID=A0A8S5R7L4_9VIRU|nr:MAG TPA: hypothetical protein [virus sp. ct8MV80]
MFLFLSTISENFLMMFINPLTFLCFVCYTSIRKDVQN